MGKKILVVDDSETLRSQLRSVLEAARFGVVEAFNGKNGIEMLQNTPDVGLVLCDVNMPEMDGLTMCERIHQMPHFNRIPIIMLTTEANPDMKKRGKDAGVIAWMTKPVNNEKITAAIRKVLEKSHG